MPTNRKAKLEARARKARTGEKYVTARRHVLGLSDGPQDEPLTAQGPAPVSAPNLRDQIRAVLDSFPDLTEFGFRPVGGTGTGGISSLHKPDHFRAERDGLLTEHGVQQVENCLAYLALLPKARSAKPRGERERPDSYYLKHEVEAWLVKAEKRNLDKYVSNGAFIVAAVIAGFKIHREDRRSPNCAVGVERDAVRLLGEGKDPHQWEKKTGFVKWLFKQKGRNDPVGDLASDVRIDHEFPRMGDVAAIRAYLDQYSEPFQRAFEQARVEYQSKGDIVNGRIETCETCGIRYCPQVPAEVSLHDRVHAALDELERKHGRRPLHQAERESTKQYARQFLKGAETTEMRLRARPKIIYAPHRRDTGTIV